MTEPSRRSLTIAYVLALAVVAAMSVFSHLILDQSLARHEGTAALINASGRQRMLSQRIAGFAAQVMLGMPTARADLVAALDDFERAHRALLPATPSAKSGSLAARLNAIYFGGDHPLATQVDLFVARGRRIAAMAGGDPAMTLELTALLAAARQPILRDLDTVVRLHQAESEAQLGTLQTLTFVSLLVVLGTLVLEALGIFRPMVRRIALYSQQLVRLASVDPLTGALNRRSFAERGADELARARRYRRPTSVVMIDADRFKAVNDAHGHAGGDAVLQALADGIRRELRPSDILARLGGEEFAVLLPETGPDGALTAAERIRRHVETLRVCHEGVEIAFTISLGVAECAVTDLALDGALGRADAALYLAKAGGRNRTVAAEPSTVVDEEPFFAVTPA